MGPSRIDPKARPAQRPVLPGAWMDKAYIDPSIGLGFMARGPFHRRDRQCALWMEPNSRSKMCDDSKLRSCRCAVASSAVRTFRRRIRRRSDIREEQKYMRMRFHTSQVYASKQICKAGTETSEPNIFREPEPRDIISELLESETG